MWFKKLSRNPLLEARSLFNPVRFPSNLIILIEQFLLMKKKNIFDIPLFHELFQKFHEDYFAYFASSFLNLYIYQIIEITTRKSSANKFLKNEIKRLFLSFEEKWNFPSNLSFHSLFSFFFLLPFEQASEYQGWQIEGISSSISIPRRVRIIIPSGILTSCPRSGC